MPLTRKTPLKRSSFKKTGKSTGLKRKSVPKVKESGKKPRTKTQAQLKKELDAVFSKFIRQHYADGVTGMVKCYTCSVYKHWKEIQNGHWIPRNILATRFSEDNCRPQCVACNMFQKGMPDVFAVNLLKEGVDIVALQQGRYKILKLDRHWYQEKIDHYKTLIE